jgi:hypothetical protein
MDFILFNFVHVKKDNVRPVRNMLQKNESCIVVANRPPFAVRACDQSNWLPAL